MFVTVAPAVTSSAVDPVSAALAMRIRSGLLSHCGMQHGGFGTGAGAWMPASRNGRDTPGSTPLNTPLEVDVAVDSVMLPPVGLTTFNVSTWTRIPSYFSRLSTGDD